MFNRLDHIAIVVKDTEEALKFYRDVLGFPVVVSEVVNDPPIRLTHLDLGNTHLQLVEPIDDDHPLQEHLANHGETLHHICFYVDDVAQTVSLWPERGLAQRGDKLHSGPNGREAAFMDPTTTRGIVMEITGEGKRD